MSDLTLFGCRTNFVGSYKIVFYGVILYYTGQSSQNSQPPYKRSYDKLKILGKYHWQAMKEDPSKQKLSEASHPIVTASPNNKLMGPSHLIKMINLN